MQPTQNWDSCDGAELVRAPKIRRILVQHLTENAKSRRQRGPCAEFEMSVDKSTQIRNDGKFCLRVTEPLVIELLIGAVFAQCEERAIDFPSQRTVQLKAESNRRDINFGTDGLNNAFAFVRWRNRGALVK